MTGERADQMADLVFYNANVLTQDPLRPQAQLVAVKEGRISWVGSNDDREQLLGPGTRLVDCAGRTLIPGFVDAHMHFLALASSLLAVDCRPPAVTSIPQLLAAVRRRAEKAPPGTWIRAAGYNEFYLRERRHPTRWELDEAAPENPVKLSHRSGHACVLNGLALRLAHIHEETPEPSGALFDRDLESGKLTGLLLGMERYLEEKVLPPLSPEELARGARLASRECLSHGVTAVHDATEGNTVEDWHTFLRLRREGALVPRLTMMLGVHSLGQAEAQGLGHGQGDARLRLGGAKVMLDETTGRLQPSAEELTSLVLGAQARGWPVAIHAIEERAVAAALDALEAAQRVPGASGLRHRVEHCSVCPPPLLARLARVRPLVVTQPAFLYYGGERYLAEVAEAQRPWLYRIGSMLRAGIDVAASSDAPVVPLDSLVGIYAAATRRAENGQEVVAAEAISPEQALALFTRKAARALGLEEGVGSLAPGQRADLALLSGDPTRVPPEEIRAISVEATFLDGQPVWEGEPPAKRGRAEGWGVWERRE